MQLGTNVVMRLRIYEENIHLQIEIYAMYLF